MNRLAAEFDYMSLDEFEEALADKPRFEKWELIGGRVVRLMVGARWEHARIVQNIASAIEAEFRKRGSPCQTFTETFFMKERALESATLPDVMVVCGDLEPGATSTNEPVVLVEVTSRGRADRDRHEKWNIYRQLRSLRHYVIVERAVPDLTVFDRAEVGWAMREIRDIEQTLDLPALDLSIPLAEIYRRVL